MGARIGAQQTMSRSLLRSIAATPRRTKGQSVPTVVRVVGRFVAKQPPRTGRGKGPGTKGRQLGQPQPADMAPVARTVSGTWSRVLTVSMAAVVLAQQQARMLAGPHIESELHGGPAYEYDAYEYDAWQPDPQLPRRRLQAGAQPMRVVNLLALPKSGSAAIAMLVKSELKLRHTGVNQLQHCASTLGGRGAGSGDGDDVDYCALDPEEALEMNSTSEWAGVLRWGVLCEGTGFCACGGVTFVSLTVTRPRMLRVAFMRAVDHPRRGVYEPRISARKVKPYCTCTCAARGGSGHACADASPHHHL